MKMTNIEKIFVNRQKKAERNVKKIQHAFKHIELERIHTVLELGCGVGFVSKYLAESYNWVIYGTDYDADQIRIAEKLQPKMARLHFQVEDAAILSFENTSMDLVIAQNVFHHIPDWENAMQEIVRVLRPGGYFIWLDLSFPKMVKKIFLPFVKNYGLYTINDIETSFKTHGLTSLLRERLAHGPFAQYHLVLRLD